MFHRAEQADLTTVEIGSELIALELRADVFRPTSTSILLGSVTEVIPGTSFLDMGCGCGVLAIMAAKKGAAPVYAVDVSPEACSLSQSNVKRNGVGEKVHVLSSDLFANLPDIKFDLIVDDVSGVADEVARLAGWYPPPIPTGGADGTEAVIKMLESSPRFLKPGGVLLFPVLGLSRAGAILEAAKQVFGPNLKVVAQKEYPFPMTFYSNMDTLNALREQGAIDFIERRSRYLWRLQIFRARLPT